MRVATCDWNSPDVPPFDVAGVGAVIEGLFLRGDHDRRLILDESGGRRQQDRLGIGIRDVHGVVAIPFIDWSFWRRLRFSSGRATSAAPTAASTDDQRK